eukprot:scaffold178342_cov17-Tisochrysis_lutea.AAC.1
MKTTSLSKGVHTFGVLDMRNMEQGQDKLKQGESTGTFKKRVKVPKPWRCWKLGGAVAHICLMMDVWRLHRRASLICSVGWPLLCTTSIHGRQAGTHRDIFSDISSHDHGPTTHTCWRNASFSWLRE